MSTITEREVIDLSTFEPVSPASPATARHRLRRRVAQILFGVTAYVGGFLLFLFVLSPVVGARQEGSLLRRFQGLANGGPASVVNWHPSPGTPIAILAIPGIGLETVVVEGTTSRETMKGPGHFAVSPMPGEMGNVVLMGRRSTFGAPFARLGALRKGDRIQVATGMGEFTYEVSGVERVEAGDEDVIGPSADDRLTLVTSSAGLTVTGRTAVIADLRGAPVGAQPRAGITTEAETGLAGDLTALPAFLVWAELLIVAVVGALWIRRRLSWRIAWLVGTPLVLAFAWASYLSLARVLPSTL